jgi:predicted CopG family antitoxin
MSKNISISDEVYRKLKREKGDRSFSELLEDRLEASGKLADVTGQRIFDDDACETVKTDVRELSEGTFDRLEDETR